ncbi:Peptidase M10A protein [Dioscorea alata]|uniref:Peptidase M10A protein n=1 Tax=Dioscorea alata TaxID=55571 RepID=A0ACB7VKK3_DIOAL|nr:Peptidase M10A protein [Dioscorea alata]
MMSFIFFAFLVLPFTYTNSVFAFPPLPSFPPIPSFTNPWEGFQNLSGCHPGDNVPGISDLKQYLHDFGYISNPPPANFTNSFDDELEAAIKTYQKNFKLNVTGFLDPSTINQMTLPRCGMPDIINGTSTMASSLHGRKLYTYFTGNPRWPSSKSQLTYAFTSTSSVSISTSTLSTVISRAFSRWAATTTLTFTEVGSDSDPDITIGFYSGDHGDGEPFDGVLGTLAHAFSPTDGRFHLDAAEQWVAEGDVTTASSDAAIDLESVAVHEIGHLLGLGHTSVESAIMYPTIKTKTKKVELAEDDVVGIQNLYGKNPNYTGVAPATTVQQRDTSDAGLGLGLGFGSLFWRVLVVGGVVGGLVLG